MQKLLILSITIFLSLQLRAGGDAAFTRAELVASGLTCSMCSNAIYKALTQLPFVDKVTPDVEHSSFAIVFKTGVTPDIDALQQAVVGAGFSVDKLTVTLSLDHVPVQNDAHVMVNGLTFHFVHVPAETLNGETTLRLVDKDFLPTKTYKQYGAYTAMACYKTGRMASTRIYHVTI
jgi:copper chaperone CopZ